MYELKFRKQVVRFINSRSPKEKRAIAEAFAELESNPYQNNLDIRPLKGCRDRYRLRIRNYRFLYAIIQDQLLIYFYKADTRGDVYK